MAEEEKPSGSKLVGIAGGGGVGAFLIKFAVLVSDPFMRDLYLSSVPFFSLILGHIFTFLSAVVSVDASATQTMFRLKFLKWKLYWGMKNLKASPQIRELARQRYDVIIGIEMGVYSITSLSELMQPAPAIIPTSPPTPPPTPPTPPTT